MNRYIACALFGVVSLPSDLWAAESLPINDIGKISLETLGNIVTSVSRKPEDSFRAAAAIYVITNDDIKSSGATHIAEVLRGVPGLDVAQIDSSDWAISSRGFNGAFANKLLVQVDGRTVYTPLFAGVYWNSQNIPLEDVERIEIIRGPGATQWGANAVNGIINVITKHSSATQGTYISALTGTHDTLVADARYGGKISDNAYYRAYAEFADRNATPLSDNSSGHNAWRNGKSGFRSDWNVSTSRKITVQGDAYSGSDNFFHSSPSFAGPDGINLFKDTFDYSGGNILGRLEEKHSDTMQSRFQTYLDYQHIDYTSLKQDLYTFDLDYQTSWKVSDRHSVMWGAEARLIGIDIVGTQDITVAKDINSQTIFSAFLQDTYAISPQELYFTLGSKFEHNSFTGFEFEPSARLAWYPDNKQTFWAAVSRAVRTPNIVEESWYLNSGSLATNLISQLQFNSELKAEDLIAYEFGHRIKPIQNLTFDSTVFINDYNNLETLEPLDLVDAGGGNFYVPFQASNLGEGRAYGFEESVNWDVTSIWNLKGSYSYINLLLDKNSSQDTTFMGKADDIPHHKFMLRSQLYLPNDVRLINTGYYVGKLANQGIDPYFRFDTRIVWKATNNIELSLDGQNLLDDKHPEFGGTLNSSQNEIPRAFYGRVVFRY